MARRERGRQLQWRGGGGGKAVTVARRRRGGSYSGEEEEGRQLQWRGGGGEVVTVVERRGRQLPQPHLSLAVQAISCSGKWLVKPMALITE